jgi:hypothetical protein
MHTRYQLIPALALGLLLQFACSSSPRPVAEAPAAAPPGAPPAESGAAPSGAEPAFRLLRTTHLAASKLDAISVSKIAADGERGLVAIGRRSRSRNAADLVIARLDLTGQQRWMRSFPGSEIIAGDLFVAAGRIVVVGTLRAGRVDFASNVLRGQGQLDGFVAALSLVDGTPIWAKTIGGTKAAAACSAVAPGDDGSFYITGYLAGTVDIGDGPTSCTGQCAYLVKWSSDGAHIWTRTLVAPKYSHGIDVATANDGDVSIVGSFKEEIVAADQRFVGHGADSDIFAGSYSPSGDLRWLRVMGSAENEVPFAVARDIRGRTAIVGVISPRGRADLGGNALLAGGAFVAMYEIAGEHLWSRRLDSPEQLLLADTAITGTGLVLVSGRFRRFVDIGTGKLEAYHDPVLDQSTAFLAAFSAAGRPLASARLGDERSIDGSSLTISGSALAATTLDLAPPRNSIHTFDVTELGRGEEK